MKTRHATNLGLATALALIACSPASLEAQGILIDDFSYSVPRTNSTTVLSRSGHMLFGNVDLVSSHTSANEYPYFEVSGGRLKLDHPSFASPRYVYLIYDGTPGGTDPTFTMSPVDLTGGGTNDRIKIRVLNTVNPLTIQLRVYSSAANYYTWTESIESSGTPGILEFPFGSPDITSGSGATFTAVSAIQLRATISGNQVAELDWITAGDYVPVPPDTARPALKFLNKKKLKTPRPRHTVKGQASDNVAVAKVEARSRLRKGWRKARLRPSGRFKYRTPKLNSGKNVVRFRAIDTSGNRSKVKRARPVGK